MGPSSEAASSPTRLARLDADRRASASLSQGWEAACSPPRGPHELPALGELSWLAASVPGTAAGVLREAGLWEPGEPLDLDQDDWWFRTRFTAADLAGDEQALLALDGVATVAEVYLNGEHLLDSVSMFRGHAVELGARLKRENELLIRCRALAPLLAEPRKPRARWRTRLVAERNLRFFRTMLIGRAPGFAPGPAAVGPWRPVVLHRRRGVVVDALELQPRLSGSSGVLGVRARLGHLGGGAIDSVLLRLEGPTGEHVAPLEVQGGVVQGELTVAEVQRWWPHTHGEPALYRAQLLVESGSEQRLIDLGRVGFRELRFSAGPDLDFERDGIDLHVNGVRVFARGAVWTPIDPVGMTPSEAELRAELRRARAAGMNMLRLPGTSAYEAPAFHDLCDELGILVWQDMMFANFDYPLADDGFRAEVRAEAIELAGAVAARPSLAVVCGNSEVEQQVAMMGLDPSLGRGELFGELLPGLIAQPGIDALYVPSAPCGGDLPFRPDCGVANYYGVGGYRRPIEDARRADVRFASECLAFSNLAAEPPAGRDDTDNYVLRTGIPRDVGADWDFKDVRDHYLGELYGVDPVACERDDPERYHELSRSVSGEVMAEVFGEWRRPKSRCGGGLVLWMRDVVPGAGWGLIDRAGVPKLAYRHLRRVLAPVAVWTIDEGLGGIVAHVANDRPQPLYATLRVSLYRDRELLMEEGTVAVELGPHSQGEWNVETVIGHFRDAGWAYRFGAPAQDVVVVTLERAGGHQDGVCMIGQAMRFPAGRPVDREAPDQLGLTISTTNLRDGGAWLALHTKRLAYGVTIDAPGHIASDDGFSIEPGGARCVTLQPTRADSSLDEVRIRALNMEGTVRAAPQVPAG